jgi:hypothetical protein
MQYVVQSHHAQWCAPVADQQDVVPVPAHGEQQVGQGAVG